MNQNIRNRRLFASHLNLNTTEADLNCFFAQYGVVISVLLKRDRVTDVSWGTAYVEMATEREAKAAIKNGNYQLLDARQISVGRVRNQ